MAKAPKRAFVCNECGADYPRWQGQCSACHAWNTITEVRLAASPTVARNERLSGYAGSAGVAKVQKLSDISLEELGRQLHPPAFLLDISRLPLGLRLY